MTAPSESTQTISFWRMTFRSILSLSILFAFLFVPAGRLDYWQGELFFVSSACLTVSFAILFRKKSDLMNERLKPGPGIKWWDKIILGFFLPFFYAILITGSWDSGRCSWSGALPAWMYGLGYLFYFAGLGIFMWAMWINHFFSGVVRIQSDRGHTVVENGPYAYVRHPGYVGMIVMTCGMPLCLGSLYALIPAFCATLVLLIRACLEDAALQAELPGYKEYAKRVRWRLIRRVW